MSDLTITCDRCKNEITHVCSTTLKEAALSLYSYMLDSVPDGMGSMPIAPFFSESFLYEAFGKDQARSILARVNNLLRAAGLEPHVLQVEAWDKLAAEKTERDAQEAIYKANREKRRKAKTP